MQQTYLFIYLFSSLLGSLCVPLFFFISGYYFFYGCEKYGINEYKRKVFKRVNSLLVPYLVWNLLTVLIYVIIERRLFTVSSFFSAFWEYNYDNIPRSTPINGPLWFLRDLILLSIVSPVIYWIVRKEKIIPVILLLVAWLFSTDYYTKFFSLAFFTLGAYFSIKQINIVSLLNKNKVIVLSGYFIMLFFLCYLYLNNIRIPYLFKVYIIIGLFSCFYLVSKIILNTNYKQNSFLVAGSFFIYVSHNLIEGKIRVVLKGLIGIDSSFQVLCVYFITVIVTIIILLSLYGILKKIPIFSFIWGGR